MDTIIFNDSYGGLIFSKDLKHEFLKLGGIKKHFDNFSRDDPLLIQAIRNLGTVKASYEGSKVRLCTIPELYKGLYKIVEVDGLESVTIDSANLAKRNMWIINITNCSSADARDLFKEVFNFKLVLHEINSLECEWEMIPIENCIFI